MIVYKKHVCLVVERIKDLTIDMTHSPSLSTPQSLSLIFAVTTQQPHARLCKYIDLLRVSPELFVHQRTFCSPKRRIHTSPEPRRRSKGLALTRDFCSTKRVRLICRQNHFFHKRNFYQTFTKNPPFAKEFCNHQRTFHLPLPSVHQRALPAFTRRAVHSPILYNKEPYVHVSPVVLRGRVGENLLRHFRPGRARHLLRHGPQVLDRLRGARSPLPSPSFRERLTNLHISHFYHLVCTIITQENDNSVINRQFLDNQNKKKTKNTTSQAIIPRKSK